MKKAIQVLHSFWSVTVSTARMCKERQYGAHGPQNITSPKTGTLLRLLLRFVPDEIEARCRQIDQLIQISKVCSCLSTSKESSKHHLNTEFPGSNEQPPTIMVLEQVIGSGDRPVTDDGASLDVLENGTPLCYDEDRLWAARSEMANGPKNPKKIHTQSALC